jgi:hypothetical protein
MALREFPDSSGRIWEVWDTHPKERNSADTGESTFSKYMADQIVRGGNQPSSVRHEYEAGWLTFKLGGQRRRLAPIPADWERADDDTLRRYLDSSQEMSRSGPTR